MGQVLRDGIRQILLGRLQLVTTPPPWANPRDHAGSLSGFGIDHYLALMQVSRVRDEGIDLRPADRRLCLRQLDGGSSPVRHIPHDPPKHICRVETLHITVHSQSLPTKDLLHRATIHFHTANNRHITHPLPYGLQRRSNISDRHTARLPDRAPLQGSAQPIPRGC